MMTRRRLMLTATAVLTAGASTPEIATWVGTALGADARLRIEGRGAEDALQEVLGIVERLEAEFSLYRRLSSLSRLNAEGHLTPPPRPMVDLLHLARRIHTATRGTFDPTVQPLWRALAEGRDTGAALDAIGFDRVRVTPDLIELATGQALTLNGIAQGWITDRAVEALARRGFTRALVDLGEVRATREQPSTPSGSTAFV